MKLKSFGVLVRSLLPWFGLVLMGAVFAFAAWRVALPAVSGSDQREVIRIAHWQLEAGIRQGIDAVARAYEKLHPDVRIEQILVPERVYPTWLTTRLVGGTAPEIVELISNYDSARVARFFHPIGVETDLPNPYNSGSPLEGLPWRNTFIDGLASGYHAELAEYYGVAPFTGSRALYFNIALLRTLTGSEAPPASYAELEDVLCRLVAFSKQQDKVIVGFAMHRASVTALFNDLFAAQFQELGTAMARGTGLPVSQDEFYAARLSGRWNFAHPDFRAALESLRELSVYFPPGFAQLGREDAMLAFVQGRALFYYSGTWDATNLAAQAKFPVGVTRAITPGEDHPRFGKGVRGPLANEDRTGNPAFSVTRNSPRTERAIDFLRFLTSDPGNRLFSQASGWMPSVVGVPGPKSLAGVLTKGGGYPRGPMMLGGADTGMAFARELSRLTGAGGGVEAFLETFEPIALTAMKSDLNRVKKSAYEGLRRDDVAIAAGRVIAGQERVGVVERRAQSQNEREAQLRALETELEKAK